MRGAAGGSAPRPSAPSTGPEGRPPGYLENGKKPGRYLTWTQRCVLQNTAMQPETLSVLPLSCIFDL